MQSTISSSLGGEFEQSQESQAIKALLERYAAKELDVAQLEEELAAACRVRLESTWEALALIDQYHRRRVLATEDFLHIKQVLNQQVFGANARAGAASPPPAPAKAQPQAQAPAPVPMPARQDAPAARVLRDAEDLEDHEIGELHGGNDEPPEADAHVWERVSAHGPALDEHHSLPPVHIESAPRSDAASSSSMQLRAGQVLSERYVIVSPLRRSQREAVYKAFDRHRSELPQDDRYVTLKVLVDPRLSREQAARDLKAEYGRLQALTQRNFLAAVDCVTDGQPPFIVMEFVTAEPLARMLERLAPRRMSKAQALAIAREIASALIYLHSRGIAHGALSPDNVLIAADGGLKLVNLNPQGHVGGEGPDTTEFSYASPQRLAGEPAESSDDLYSLACITYELLTGAVPFSDADILGQGARVVRRSGLTARQWSGLKAALSWNRERRPRGVREWAQKFDWSGAATKVSSEASVESVALTRPKTKSSGFWPATLMLATCIAVGFLAWRFFALDEVAEQFMRDMTRERASIASERQTADAQQSPAPAAATQGAPDSTPNVTPAPNKPVGRESPAKNPSAAPAVPASQPTLQRTGAAAGSESISFSESNYTVNPGETVARITVRRFGPVDRELVFHWRTIDGSAKAERDFVRFRDSVERFAPGQRTAVILIPIVDDEQRKESEWFDVELKDPSAGELGELARTSVFILTVE